MKSAIIIAIASMLVTPAAFATAIDGRDDTDTQPANTSAPVIIRPGIAAQPATTTNLTPAEHRALNAVKSGTIPDSGSADGRADGDSHPTDMEINPVHNGVDGRAD
jgi:hypothetical protein